MMGSTYPTPILPPNDGASLFDGVRDSLNGADIVFGNLEAPFLEKGIARKCAGVRSNGVGCFEFRMPTRYVKYLSQSGFNTVGVANNHILDFGGEGLQSTLKTLKAAGIAAVGGERVARFNIRGKNVVLVGFSFSCPHESTSILNLLKAAETVQNLKKENDIVIVSFHGGAEGKEALHVSDVNELFGSEMRGNVVKFSRTAVDAGADMVIGHGPHVLRAMEIYRGKLIVYSLGNFLTYGRFNIKGPNGISLILKANIDSSTGNFTSGQIIPVKLKERGIPFLDADKESIRLVRQLTEEDIKSSSLMITENGHLYPHGVALVTMGKAKLFSLLDHLKKSVNPGASIP